MTLRRAGETTRHSVRGKYPKLLRLPGVYPPQEDSFLLAQTLVREPVGSDTRVLDVGAGSGVLSVSAGLAGARRITAVDVDRRSLLNTWLNAALNGVRVQVVCGDLTTPLQGREFDLIVSNPPYVPSTDDHLPTRGLARCWDAGRDGRAYLDRICREVPRVLAPDGVLLLLQSAFSGVDASRALLQDQGLDVDIVASAEIPFGPVLEERTAMLRDRGLMKRDDDHENLVIFRAVK